jgi:hypothetical protein
MGYVGVFNKIINKKKKKRQCSGSHPLCFCAAAAAVDYGGGSACGSEWGLGGEGQFFFFQRSFSLKKISTALVCMVVCTNRHQQSPLPTITHHLGGF